MIKTEIGIGTIIGQIAVLLDIHGIAPVYVGMVIAAAFGFFIAAVIAQYNEEKNKLTK